MINIDATLWVSDPTWPSHVGMAKHMGLKLAKYRYFDAATSNVDTAAMMEDIQAMQPGDVLLLHGLLP